MAPDGEEEAEEEEEEEVVAKDACVPDDAKGKLSPVLVATLPTAVLSTITVGASVALPAELQFPLIETCLSVRPLPPFYLPRD